jgi:hypothetical protein
LKLHSILEPTNGNGNVEKENLVKTLKMATKNNKPPTPIKGENDPNP